MNNNETTNHIYALKKLESDLHENSLDIEVAQGFSLSNLRKKRSMMLAEREEHILALANSSVEKAFKDD